MRKIKYTNKDNEVMVEEYSQTLAETLHNDNIDYEIGYSCANCGEFIPDGYETTVYSNNSAYVVCESCLDAGYNSGTYYQCEDCDTIYDDTVGSYETHDGRIICTDCRNNNYTECSNCGALYPDDDTHYCNDCDEYFCDDCWYEHDHTSNLLYDYHRFNDWQPKKTADEPEPQFYIGHELEIDDGDDMREAVEQITNNLNGVCMHDSSLSEDGIEFISHPLSYKYMLSLENDYRTTFTNLINMGYRSHDTSTCGLHFHVTRPENSDVIDRIILFMETYKDEIIRLSRRTTGEISDWCQFLSDRRTDVKEKTLKSLDYIKKNKEISSRYMALNLTNRNTIEFRIFKGTLNYETFMADFEFVYYLTTLASDLSLPIEELTWKRVVNNGRFLQYYCNDHDLHTDKPIVDYTTEIIVERNKEKEQIEKDLKILYKKVVKIIHKMTQLDNRKKQFELINKDKFDRYSSWLSYILDDIKRLNTVFENDWQNDVESIKYRITYIKERIDD